MKISHIRSQILVLPEADPLAGSPENPNAARPIVILRLGTDDGIEGIAVTFYGGAITRSLKAAVDDLGALTIGEDPLHSNLPFWGYRADYVLPGDPELTLRQLAACVADPEETLQDAEDRRKSRGHRRGSRTRPRRVGAAR